MMIPELQQLRSLLVPLVESFELDDPSMGIVAWTPVVGGTFVHPLTRQPISKLKIYAAGADKIKIIEPRFLYSLPALSILGLSNPSHLCYKIAKMLGETLGNLGKLRDEIASLGITLDLEHDILRLKGSAEIMNTRVQMVSRLPDSLVLTHLGTKALYHLDTRDRSLLLSHNAQNDLDELAKLVQQIITATEQQNSRPPSDNPQGKFTKGTSDVMILTDMVEEDSSQEPPIQHELSQQEHPQQEELAPLRVDYIFEMTGADTEIWAHGNRLRLKIPFNVVQGHYVFYLEQVHHKQFKGVLISPQGTRHPVDVDFTSIMDIKEVFDRIMLM